MPGYPRKKRSHARARARAREASKSVPKPAQTQAPLPEPAVRAHEQDAAYQQSLAFVRTCTDLGEETQPTATTEALAALMDTARSMTLSVAKAHSGRIGKERSGHADAARDAAFDAAVLLDVLAATGACREEDAANAKAVLRRMLAALAEGATPAP